MQNEIIEFLGAEKTIIANNIYKKFVLDDQTKGFFNYIYVKNNYIAKLSAESGLGIVFYNCLNPKYVNTNLIFCTILIKMVITYLNIFKNIYH
jgi:hypothetical protein